MFRELKKVIEADIPHIYSNGFSVVLGTGDVIILLKKMGHDIATLSLSYTVAKTLSEKLGGVGLSLVISIMPLSSSSSRPKEMVVSLMP